MDFRGFIPADKLALEGETIRLSLVRTAAADPVKRWVPAYHFEMRRKTDDTVVGITDLRIGYNESTYWGGNIGYAVHPPHRGHSYAGEAVKLLFGVAALHEMPYVLIAVDTENRSSQRVCEKLCGVRLGPLVIPLDNDRYLEGERTTYLYRFALPYGND